MSGPRVDFTPGPASPVLEAGSLGIVVRVDARSAYGRLTTLRLHGTYRVTVDEARTAGAVPLHRALVVTATAGPLYRAWNLLEETVAFDDDEHTGGGLVTGCFNADLLEHFDVPPYGAGYVLVSMGPRVSNVAAFSATT